MLGLLLVSLSTEPMLSAPGNHQGCDDLQAQ